LKQFHEIHHQISVSFLFDPTSQLFFSMIFVFGNGNLEMLKR